MKLHLLTHLVSAQLVVSNYPTLDATAPAQVSWSHYFLSTAQVPNIPVRTEGVPNPDWSQDFITCPGRQDWALTYDDGPGLPPPFGDIDPRVRAVLRSMGMNVVLWNRDTNDASSMTVNATFAQWFSQPQIGTISLQHDLFQSAAAQIPQTLNMTANTGYRYRTVVDCLGRTDAYRPFPNIPTYVPPVVSSSIAARATAQPTAQPSTSITRSNASGLQIAASVLAAVLGFFFLGN
jgi:hypothetical protein